MKELKDDTNIWRNIQTIPNSWGNIHDENQYTTQSNL